MNNISIGIRTYNVQHYIEDCLNSVYNQSIKNTVKVFLVDDCSQDATLNVIYNWINTHLDFQIEVFTNDKNRGPGVMFMQLQEYINDSEYVIFLDGDDFYIKNDCLEYMYNFIKRHDFDFVQFSKHLDDYHTKNLIKFELFKQIKFNQFRFAEDHYHWWLQNITSNYVLHDYDFYYYRNNFNSLVRTNTSHNILTKVFDQIYYQNIPEAGKQLQYIIPQDCEQEAREQLLHNSYELYPAVLVLTRNTNLHEFIKHYYNLGFKEIFVLDNNDSPIYYQDVNIIPYNHVKLIDFPEFQATAYDYALRLIKQTKVNYLLVVDDDEYLELKSHSNIINFINEELLLNGKYNCDFIWETYDDNDIIYEKDVKDSIQSTYTRKLQYGKCDDISSRQWTKSLYRVFPYINYSRSLNPGHNPTDLYYNKNIISTNKAVLKHYRTQCLETFLKSKVLQKNFKNGQFGRHGLLNAYFHINTCSITKLNAYKELCDKYNIEYDREEFDKYMIQYLNSKKVTIIIPVINSSEVKLLDNFRFSDDFNVIVASTIDLNIETSFQLKQYGTNIYDCLTNIIKTLDTEYASIIFPTSIIYEDKFEKQLNVLKNDINLDVVTCKYKYNGVVSLKSSISTVMFRVNSVKHLDLLFEDYYSSYDKFFINIRNLKTYELNEVLQEESIEYNQCLYNTHNLFNQQINKNITAIITFQNEGIEVKKTIESIRSTTVGIPILLIDDFSTDNYDYKSLADIYNCTYIRNDHNLGVAGSRDLGVKLCKTEYFVLLDGHMRFYDIDWDLNLLQLLQQYPDSIFCSNTSEIRQFKNQGYVTEQKFYNGVYASYINFFGKDSFSCRWSFRSLDDGDITRVSCIMGACYISSKKHWENIRGLEGLIKYGCDEQLISMKTWLSGGKCFLIKDFYTGHLYRNSSPYYVTSDYVKANQIFLALFFDYGLDEIRKNTDVLVYDRSLNLLDLQKIQEMKDNFKQNIQKYSIDYFLNINNQVQ